MISMTIELKTVARDPNRYGKLAAACKTYKTVEPLITEYERTLMEDLYIGVMTGVGGNDQPIQATSYRQSTVAPPAPSGQKVGRFGVGPRDVVQYGRTPGKPKFGTGSPPSYWPENPSTEKYKTWRGPPCAPRWVESRILANYETSHFQRGADFVAIGQWRDFVDRDGQPIIPRLFARRNHSGIRRWGQDEAQRVTRAFLDYLLETFLQ
jgi:hypothetical protein